MFLRTAVKIYSYQIWTDSATLTSHFLKILLPVATWNQVQEKTEDSVFSQTHWPLIFIRVSEKLWTVFIGGKETKTSHQLPALKETSQLFIVGSETKLFRNTFLRWQLKEGFLLPEQRRPRGHAEALERPAASGHKQLCPSWCGCWYSALTNPLPIGCEKVR